MEIVPWLGPNILECWAGLHVCGPSNLFLLQLVRFEEQMYLSKTENYYQIKQVQRCKITVNNVSVSLMRSRGGDSESITYKHSLLFASGLKPEKYFSAKCLRTTLSAVNFLANENDSFQTFYRFFRTTYTSIVSRVLFVNVDVSTNNAYAIKWRKSCDIINATVCTCNYYYV